MVVSYSRDKIQDSKQTLKELETTHNNYMKRQEELDNDMRKCKEEFKEFERQDVKYREDFKHVNQKIKKLEDKVEKEEGSHSLWQLKVKDSSKIEALIKEGEESTVLIPKLKDNIPKLQKLLLDEEKVLEEITESSKGEVGKGNAEIALSLVGYEEELQSAMEYVFGSTFVCKAIDAAKEVAFNREIHTTSVTLEGDIF
ncbi:hypothetical protein JHK86_042920 [Glycine max]|nr:hypothetical protein JHK86_042920 [Glycine max]